MTTVPDTPTPHLSPVRESERLSAVDTLRGFALLGILAMNIVAFGLPLEAYMNPVNEVVNRYAGEFTGANAIIYYVCSYVFSLKMMTIFSMLFGAGVVMMDTRAGTRERMAAPSGSRANPPRFAAIYYRRLLWLFLFGMVHAYIIWFGDILVAYALCGLVLYPMRRLRPRTLIAIGGALIVVMILVGAGMAYGFKYMDGAAAEAQAVADAGGTLSAEQEGILKGWKEVSEDFNPSPEGVAANVARFRGGPSEVLGVNAEYAVTFQTFYFLINTMWWSAGVMLIGMALMRLGVFAAARSTGFYVRLALAGYAVGAAFTFLGLRHDFAHGFQPVPLFMVGLPLHSVGSLATALGHVGAVMLACKRGAAPWLMRRLAAVGRMAFTNYVMQSLICTTIFYGWGLGQYARHERAEVYVVVVAVWALQLLLSPWWLARYQYGPAEWVWRSLTYWKRQPMRRGASSC